MALKVASPPSHFLRGPSVVQVAHKDIKKNAGDLLFTNVFPFLSQQHACHSKCIFINASSLADKKQGQQRELVSCQIKSREPLLGLY